ncbi:L-rhamnose-binding lectin SML-like [Hippocampus zosterae]|uniref:L-rhamnose-binding lectin SML-like n=1 Tax=Hippocampus zosterae TaxID=109293 RepID=UPI00223CB26D|nr:L-rhamnose-binding lectin SML-like [Hippocampus zosterae]
MDSYRFRLSAVLLLATTCLLHAAVSDYVDQVTTCDNNVWQVHRLYCDRGVINVTGSLYGRSNSLVCAEGKSHKRLANTKCSQQGTVDKVKTSCNGKKSCELGLSDFRTPDPCVGTFKYLQTNFTCLEAITVVTCEGSVAHLYCGMGRVIDIYGADYGRRDKTTCSYRRGPHGLRNITCLQPTPLVAQMCNGRFSCSVTASNAVFTDPCIGTYKYLEISYACKPPKVTHQGVLQFGVDSI